MPMLNELKETIQKITAKGKGILAADESSGTIEKRFKAVGVESSEDTRRAYREMLVSTPDFAKYISGVILYEETLTQKTSTGKTFSEYLQQIGVVPGIKVDKGLIPLVNTQNEQTTQGLDGLVERLTEYKKHGAKFAKWRCVYQISASTPSRQLIKTNSEILARYAAICQSVGIVPIVEPEVLIDGEHTIEQCEKASESVFNACFTALKRHHVLLEGIILKPSMVISGKKCTKQASVQEVATATIRVLKHTVPASVPTINFLSGGQTAEQATAHLNLMNQENNLPWNISFSYARALQEVAMAAWKGDAKNVKAAQAAFHKRAKLNSAAATGSYNETMEKEVTAA